MMRPDFLPNKPVIVHAEPAILDEVTITTAEWCPTCDGERFTYHEVPGGVYNSWLGGWEPDETKEACERCDALGVVTRTRCARCGLLHDTDEWGLMATDAACECDPSDLVRFHYLSLELERVARSHALWDKSAVGEWNDVHYLAARLGLPVEYDRPAKIVWAFVRLGEVHGHAAFVRSSGSFEEVARGAVTQAA